MCDTVVTVGPTGVWLAKNSDREPGEAQVVERVARQRRGGRVRCTHVEIDDVEETFGVILSRPFWMWGAEMGVNERGVAIGNEAVFTTEKLDAVGLTGMDLLRLALERATSAREAVDVMTALLRAHGQGGRMGYRHEGFSYSSSFLVADGAEAWVLETAGRRFAAERVAPPSTTASAAVTAPVPAFTVRSISNALTIRAADLVDDGGPRDFAGAFGRRTMAALAGASTRAACTARLAGPSVAEMARALRDHAGHVPREGLVMSMPCAHAAGLPTRTAGQTTGSLITQLAGPQRTPTGPRVWLTGTSSPCLSVFKPVFLPGASGAEGSAARAYGPVPGAGYDVDSLWWRHERLHRLLLSDWSRFPAVRAQADALEARALADGADDEGLWQEHRSAVDAWRAAVETPGARRRPARFWRAQSALDGVPADG